MPKDQAALNNTERRSAYNYRGEAEQAFWALLTHLEARYILASYSTEGLISVEQIVTMCLQRGHTEVMCYAHKRYRVSAQRVSAKPITVEFVLIINTQKKHRGLSVDALCEKIRLAEITALHHHAEMVSSI